MNIAFCYPTFFNPLRGGVERVSYLLARELVARGHKLFFLHNKRGYECSFPFEVIVSYFPELTLGWEDIKTWYHDFLRQNSIDIVVNHCGCFGDSRLYCDTSGIAKSVSLLHMSPGVNFECLYSEISKLKPNAGISEYVKRIARILLFPRIRSSYKRSLINHYNWLSQNTDAVVMLTDRFKSELNSYCDTFRIVNAIANPLSFEISKDNKKENIVLWVGRMEPQKRPDLMIQIWKRVKSNGWKLIMIGDGSLKKMVEKQARKFDNVEFVGAVESYSYFQRARILCMTSGHEGFGMVLTEAESQGCVPMAFDSFAAVHDILKDKRQLVSWSNTKEYAEKLSSIMRDSALQKHLEMEGYTIASDFECEKIVNKWESFISTLIAH